MLLCLILALTCDLKKKKKSRGAWGSFCGQPGRVSPPCERVGGVWVWSSQRRPCRTPRRRAREVRECGDASSWPSYPWTSLCSPGDRGKHGTQFQYQQTVSLLQERQCNKRPLSRALCGLVEFFLKKHPESCGMMNPFLSESLMYHSQNNKSWLLCEQKKLFTLAGLDKAWR